MASPLRRLANARLLLPLPGARGGPETGYARTQDSHLLVIALLRANDAGYRAYAAQFIDAKAGEELLTGYVVGTAVLTDPSAWRTVDPLTLPGYDPSGLAPEILEGGRSCQLAQGRRFTRSASLLGVGGGYGTEGVGDLVRRAVGDALVVRATWYQ